MLKPFSHFSHLPKAGWKLFRLYILLNLSSVTDVAMLVWAMPCCDHLVLPSAKRLRGTTMGPDSTTRTTYGMWISAKIPPWHFPPAQFLSSGVREGSPNRRTNEKINDGKYDVVNSCIIAFWTYLGWLHGRTRDSGCSKHWAREDSSPPHQPMNMTAFAFRWEQLWTQIAFCHHTAAAHSCSLMQKGPLWLLHIGALQSFGVFPHSSE